MLSHRALVAALCASTLSIPALLGGAGPAAAANPSAGHTLDRAMFQVTVGGDQSTVWSYAHNADPNNPCDAPSKGNGSQMIRFWTEKPYTMEVTQPTNRFPIMFALWGTHRPVITGDNAIAVHAAAEREGKYVVDYSKRDMSKCKAVGSGTGDEIVPLGDCGKRNGSFEIRLGYDYALMPAMTARKWPNANWLKAIGETPNYGGQPLDFAYKNCEFEVGGATGLEGQGVSLTGADHLAERTLFKGRRIIVHLDGEYTFRSGGAYAHTLVAYNITMKPLA